MTTTSMATNPCGRTFVSYRRSAASDVQRLIVAMRARGIPTWRDVDDLESELTGDALTRALEAEDTASAVSWITPDVEYSPAIQRVELPRILQRARADGPFFVEFALAGGLDYPDADRILREVPTLDSLSNGWNVTRLGEAATDAQVCDIARRVLRRRLREIARRDAGPLQMAIHTRADAPLPFNRDTALQLDWCPLFEGRHARDGAWEDSLFPALRDVVTAIQRECSEREIIASGKCALPAGFALGRAFIEPSGLRLTWRQHTGAAEQDWSLRRELEPSGFRVDATYSDLNGEDVAVLINVRGDVEPAVRASTGLPRFAVISRVTPESGTYPASVETPGQATHLARAVAGEIRRVRTEHPYATRTHIFLSGPLGLAVLIGQQLNGLGQVQTYEHIQGDGPGTYVSAAMLSDHLQGGGPR